MKGPKEKYLDVHLSEEQLMRYQTGKMEAAEMHLIERHLLQCSLCSEAVEGYSLLDPSQAKPALEDLKARFSDKFNRESQKTPSWKWGVAATVLLLFSAGVFLVLKTLEQSPEEVVKKEVQVETVPKLSNERATSDHRPAIALKDQEVKADKIQRQESRARTPVDTVMNKLPKSIAEKATKPLAAPPAPDTVNLSAIQDIALMESFQIASANSMDRSLTSGEQPLESFPSVMSVNTPQEETAEADTNMPPEKAMEFEAELVARRSLESKKEKKLTETVTFNAGFSQAAPTIGNANFEKYLRENALYPPEAKKAGIAGNVVVEFTVSPDSTLTGFRIVAPLGHGLDEEAIRLLKAGPQWVPATLNGTPIHQKITVNVPFLLE